MVRFAMPGDRNTSIFFSINLLIITVVASKRYLELVPLEENADTLKKQNIFSVSYF